MKDKASRQKDQWVLPYFKQYKKPLILALTLGFITYVFAAALMFTSGYLISSAAEFAASILTIHLPLIFVRFFGVGKPFLQYLERLVSHDWVLRMTSSMRAKLYALLERDAAFIKQKHRTGDILGLLAEDIGHLQNLYLRVVFPTIVAWLLYVAVIIAAGFFSPWFGAALLLLLGVVVFVMPLVSVLVNGAQQARRKQLKNQLYHDLTDNILGISDWIFSQRESDYLNHYQEDESELHAINRKTNSFARRRNLLTQTIFGTIVIVIVFWAANAFAGEAGGPANWIAAFAIGFFPLIDAFAPLSEAATDLGSYRDSSRRLNEFSAAGKIEKGSSASDPLPAPTTEDHRGRISKNPAISLKQLTFTFPHVSQPVLEDINLHIPSGQKLAVLGRSGAGKSTLAALIRGDLIPEKGSVELDGFSSCKLGDEVSCFIGIIQQQTYLFNMSLIDNLRIGKADATEEEAWSVLNQVGLKEMVERLPNQLDTLVDEGGLRFSGGERHRIALARILLSQVPIVILDEPMVGLDPITEHALMSTILEALQDKTLILITHHLQGVSKMDRVVFLESGHLAIDGSPQELGAHNVYYQKLQAFDQGL